MLRRCENNAKAVETPLYHQCARDLATVLFDACCSRVSLQPEPVQLPQWLDRNVLWHGFVAYMHVPSR